MAVSDDFKSRFPEFDAVTVDQYIPILEPVWPSYWGGDYAAPSGQEIVLNLLAHLITAEISAGSDNVKQHNPNQLVACQFRIVRVTLQQVSVMPG